MSLLFKTLASLTLSRKPPDDVGAFPSTKTRCVANARLGSFCVFFSTVHLADPFVTLGSVTASSWAISANILSSFGNLHSTLRELNEASLPLCAQSRCIPAMLALDVRIWRVAWSLPSSSGTDVGHHSVANRRLSGSFGLDSCLQYHLPVTSRIPARLQLDESSHGFAAHWIASSPSTATVPRQRPGSLLANTLVVGSTTTDMDSITYAPLP